MSDKKVKSITVLDNVTLEALEADTQAVADRKIVDTYYSDQLNLVVKYTPGTTETNNNCYIKVWGYVGTYSETNDFPYSSTTNSQIANDTDNWVQIGTYDISSGTAIFTPTVFKVAGATGATLYSKHFSQGITFPKIRVSAYEDGVASQKGRVTVVVLIQ